MKRTLIILIAMISPLAAVVPARAATHTVTVVQRGSGAPWAHTYYWLTFGSRGHVSGQVSGTGSGRGVDLLAARFPFTSGYTRVAHTKTTSGGKYTFAVKPSLATRYRVRSAGATSRTVTFYVGDKFSLLSQSLCPERNGTCHGTVTYDTWYPAPAGAQELAQKPYVYIGVVPGFTPPTALTRRSSFTQTNQRLSSTKWLSTLHFTYSTPASGVWFMQWAWCTRTIEKRDGFGLPVGTGCGATKISTNPVRLAVLG